MLGVLTPVAGSTAAWANGPQHVQKSTFLFDNVFPAGTLCDAASGGCGRLHGRPPHGCGCGGCSGGCATGSVSLVVPGRPGSGGHGASL